MKEITVTLTFRPAEDSVSDVLLGVLYAVNHECDRIAENLVRASAGMDTFDD